MPESTKVKIRDVAEFFVDTRPRGSRRFPGTPSPEDLAERPCLRDRPL